MAVASLGCMVLALGGLWVTLVDLTRFLGDLLHYGGLAGNVRGAERTELITDIIKVLDGFLICAILIVAALGIYELFVADVTTHRRGRSARLLQIRDLDDLKERVVRLIVLILIIELFGYALRVPYETPLDLLLLAGVVLLCALTIFLTARRPGAMREPPLGRDARSRPSDPVRIPGASRA